MPEHWTIGLPTDTAVSNPASNGTVIALLKGLLTALGGGGAGTGSVMVTEGVDTMLVGATNKAARVEMYAPNGDSIVDATEPGMKVIIVEESWTSNDSSATFDSGNDVLAIATIGSPAVGVEVATGLVGTVSFEATIDNSNWFSVYAVLSDGTVATTASSFPFYGTISAAGYTQVRMRVSTYGSGSATAVSQRTQGHGLLRVLTPPLLIFRTIDLDETEEAVKASPGQVHWYYFYNAASAVRYVKFYNDTVANVSVGSTTPVLTIPLPATTAGHVAYPQGLAFSVAITVAATTALADADTGAPSANDVILNVGYA